MKKLTLIFLILVSLQAAAQQNLIESSPATNIKSTSADSIFTLSDKMAEFPGGSRAWFKYLQRNLDYVVPVTNNAPPGRYNVIVMFIIDEKGDVSELKTITNHGFGMEPEALRVIEKGPRWVPAMHNSKTVKSYRKQPITFIVGSKLR